ncbi:MAG: ribonucleotide reductase, partial [Caulobacteraceae bacterium]
MRIPFHSAFLANGIETGARSVERAGEVVEALAPVAWTSARVEAWLDWAAGLSRDYPPGDRPEALEDGGSVDPLLGGGPDSYARRAAAWGWALGLFEDADDAAAFRRLLFGLMARGLVAFGPSLPFGCRVHPLARDPAQAPETRYAAVDSAAFAAAVRGDNGPLAAVAVAIARCQGDSDACADPDANQALARAALDARAAGASWADIADAIALAAAGAESDLAGRRGRELIAVAGREDVLGQAQAARLAAFAGW